MDEAPSRIVAAVGTSSTSSRGLGKRLELAMAAAIEVAMEQGITDPEEILALKTEAYRRVKAEAAAEAIPVPNPEG